MSVEGGAPSTKKSKTSSSRKWLPKYLTSNRYLACLEKWNRVVYDDNLCFFRYLALWMARERGETARFDGETGRSQTKGCGGAVQQVRRVRGGRG